MWCYRFPCPGCYRLCATDASLVRPRVQCDCGHSFRVPKKARLVLRQPRNVDLHRIIRFVSKN